MGVVVATHTSDSRGRGFDPQLAHFKFFIKDMLFLYNAKQVCFSTKSRAFLHILLLRKLHFLAFENTLVQTLQILDTPTHQINFQKDIFENVISIMAFGYFLKYITFIFLKSYLFLKIFLKLLVLKFSKNSNLKTIQKSLK